MTYWSYVGGGFGNLFNLFLFLPYYFNVQFHLKNLFAPWKRLMPVKKTKGFSLETSLENLIAGAISRSIGFFLRTTVIMCYFISISLFVLFGAPVWALLLIVTSPFAYLLSLLFSEKKRKEAAMAVFVEKHLLDPYNRDKVVSWFDRLWLHQQKQQDLLSLDNLLAIAPVGRDWCSGFTPLLDDYTLELTADSRELLYGRDEEVKTIERSLVKSQEANVVLVGEEGVGKHAIIGGFVTRIKNGSTLMQLQHMRVLVLQMEKALAAHESHEDKVRFLEELLTEASDSRDAIIVIFDFHKYCNTELVGDFSSVWERFGREPRVKFIGVTTPFYYEHIFFHNDKIQRLFNRVNVEEVNQDKALYILQEKTVFFENKYHLSVAYESLTQIIERSKYYVTHIPFPEKALTMLEEVCVVAQQEGKNQVVPELVDKVLGAKLHTPVGALTKDLRDQLIHLEEHLSGVIVGQTHAATEIARAFQRAYVEENRSKPKVSLLFLGPTGVGKTETAKTLARLFFGNKENLLRFDMAYYQDKKNIEDLVGSYESNNPGLLASKIREKPYAVLLIDEIEKAHKDILSIFLTLLDEGYLVDGLGAKVDGKSLIVVATSNALSADIISWSAAGVAGVDLENKVREKVVEGAIFAPEFLNRFDKVLVYQPLEEKSAMMIGYSVAETVVREYEKDRHIKLTLGRDEVANWVREAFKPDRGAREIERAVREKLAEKVGKIIL